MSRRRSAYWSGWRSTRLYERLGATDVRLCLLRSDERDAVFDVALGSDQLAQGLLGGGRFGASSEGNAKFPCGPGMVLGLASHAGEHGDDRVLGADSCVDRVAGGRSGALEVEVVLRGGQLLLGLLPSEVRACPLQVGSSLPPHGGDHHQVDVAVGTSFAASDRAEDNHRFDVPGGVAHDASQHLDRACQRAQGAMASWLSLMRCMPARPIVSVVITPHERLVAATEEERRRLRRDLHDGLGPTLAGVVLGLHRTRERLETDAAAAQAQLDELARLLQDAVADVRRLVYNLRPPAVDDLGLLGAIEQQAQAMGTVEVHGVIDGDLPAAVEVAAYRIALEAMTNAVRHGGGQWCRVGLELNGALHLVIEDDGLGMPDRFRAGVGLTSMRERASELGGTCSITHRDPTGTTVRAVLPLTAEPR